MSRAVAILVCTLMLLSAAARADDSGPSGTVAQVRSEARRLLAHQTRAAGFDPKEIGISDVVAAGDQALFSWDIGKQHGLVGLVRRNDRWWDAFDATRYGNCWYTMTSYPLGNGLPYPAEYTPADYLPQPGSGVLTGDGLSSDLAGVAAVHSADVRASRDHPGACQASTYTVRPDTMVQPRGGTNHPPRFQTSGYDFTLNYSANDASSAKFTQIYFRPPTPAEFLPNHALAPGWGYPNAVCFFDVTIGGGKPLAFKSGTTIDVWFPFVLDDQLEYSLSFSSNDTPSGLIKGTIFDNTVHFVLPEFVLQPDKPLMAEIDGDLKPSH